MKKIFIKDYLFRPGEYIIGAEAIQTHACYLLYGILKEGEERELTPGDGHEEIYLVIEGEVGLESEDGSERLTKGEAVYLKGDESARIKALSGLVIYVAAGGHSLEGHRHH